MEDAIKIKTEKLNKLLIKETLFNTNGYETPEYIKQEITQLKQQLNRNEMSKQTKK